MPIFYTGKGDHGKSQIAKNTKINKTSLIIQAVGSLDELNSLCGLARTYIKNKSIVVALLEVQQNLFIMQATVAYHMFPKFKPPVFHENKVTELETAIEIIEKKMIVERKFIIPGSNQTSAWLDYLRATARRTEITLLLLNKKYTVGQPILSYINRLSSLLYALARFYAYRKKIKEDNPTYK